MLQKELVQEIEYALKRNGFHTNGDTWKKDNVAYLAIERHVNGAVAVRGRIFVDDAYGTSYMFTSAPLNFELPRETFASHIADKFLATLLESAKMLALEGALPIYERGGAI